MVARGRGVNWSVSDTINILDGGTDVSETLNMAREFASGGDFWVGGNLLACLWWYWSHEPFSTIRSEMGQELNDTWNYFKPFRFSENSSKIENRGGFGNFRKKVIYRSIFLRFENGWHWIVWKSNSIIYRCQNDFVSISLGGGGSLTFSAQQIFRGNMKFERLPPLMWWIPNRFGLWIRCYWSSKQLSSIHFEIGEKLNDIWYFF